MEKEDLTACLMSFLSVNSRLTETPGFMRLERTLFVLSQLLPDDSFCFALSKNKTVWLGVIFYKRDFSLQLAQTTGRECFVQVHMCGKIILRNEVFFFFF